jgi:ubiquitin conjugation factor E4 B
MTLLTQIEPIASIMPDLPNWIPEQKNSSGTIIEQSSLLGHLFALSPLSSGVPQMLFKDLPNMSPGTQASSITSIQSGVQAYQKQLHKICHSIINSGDNGRRRLLDWFSAVLAMNNKRATLGVDPATVASDGFMCNVVAVLNRFSKPFIEPQQSKVRIRTVCTLLMSD